MTATCWSLFYIPKDEMIVDDNTVIIMKTICTCLWLIAITEKRKLISVVSLESVHRDLVYDETLPKQPQYRGIHVLVI